MHLGSLYTAAASYLDARASGGTWLIRIEDLDLPRVVPGSAADILKALERFGFEWDRTPVYQSQRTSLYGAALESLRQSGLIFECSCSRTQLADEDRYPGHCRSGPKIPGGAMTLRLAVEPRFIHFTDRIQGTFRQNVATAVGDFVLRRRDGLFAYVLAVVVDDAAQGVTHVVRGGDLLDNTPRQLYLQQLLDLPQLAYAHVPVLTESDGAKLAKSRRSVAVDNSPVRQQLLRVFGLLNLAPPSELEGATLPELWHWAIGQWRITVVPKRLALAINNS